MRLCICRTALQPSFYNLTLPYLFNVSPFLQVEVLRAHPANLTSFKMVYYSPLYFLVLSSLQDPTEDPHDSLG